MLASDKRLGPELDLALAGRALWEQLGERFPEARLQRKGAIVLGARPEHLPIAGEWLPDARVAEPALAPGASGVLVPGELQVDPRGLTRALAAQVPTRTGADVARVEPGAVILRDGERIDAGAVIVAAGPWSAALLPELPLEPRKGHLVALAAGSVAIGHKLYEASYRDAIEAAEADLQVAAVIEQTLDGDEVLVGSSRERVGFDPAVREDVLAAMLERAARWIPALTGLRRTRAWVGFRPWLPDGLPAIGRTQDGVWVSTGHEGAGVGLGPVSGRLLAAAILDGHPIPEAFGLQRFETEGTDP